MSQRYCQPVDTSFHYNSYRFKLADIIAFLIPFLIFLEIDFGGRLFASELVACFLLPFLLFSHGKKLLKRPNALVIVMGFLWIAGLIITDIIRATLFEDFSRGWAKVFSS